MTIGIAEPLMRRYVLKAVLEDATFLATYAPHLRGEDFPSAEEAWLVDTAVAYFTAHGGPLAGDALWVELERALAAGELTEEQGDGILAIHDNLPANDLQRTYVLERAGEWLRAQALVRVATRVLADVQVGKADRIAERFEEVMAIGRPSEGGTIYDFQRGMGRWWDELSQREAAAVGTGIRSLDALIDGGLRKGNLGIWMAPTNLGKSHALIQCARVAVKAGLRVLYISLEMDEHGVMARFMATFTGIDSREVWQVPKEKMLELFRDQDLPGTLHVQRHNTDTLTLAHLHTIVNALARKQEGIDVLVIDYADLLHQPHSTNEPEYAIQARIFSGLRRLAGEFDIPVWTATQTNREALKKSVIDLSVIADSYAKARVADLIIAINRSEEEKQCNRARLFTAKSRYGLAGRLVHVTFDPKTSTFAEDPSLDPEDLNEWPIGESVT